MTTDGDDGLQLHYGFATTPNVIRASAPITLTVEVSPTNRPVTLDKLAIRIGDVNEASQLAAKFPDPDSAPADWTPSWSGRVLSLDPSGGATTATIAEALVLTFDIVVSEAPGVVPIAVAVGKNGPWTPLPVKLVKQPNDSPVTDFWADPKSIDHLEQATTLYWSVTLAGRALNYSLSAEIDGTTWLPCPCLLEGKCFAYAKDLPVSPPPPPLTETTPALTESTTFTLDAIVADDEGHLSVMASYELTVPLDAPTVNPYSAVEVVGPIAWLRWLTTGAQSVSVELDSETVGPAAPAQAWDDPYPLYIGLGAAQSLSITAYGAPTATPFPWQMGGVKAHAPSHLVTAAPALGPPALSSDGATAYIPCATGLQKVDLSQSGSMEMLTPFGDGQPCSAVAVTDSTTIQHEDVILAGSPAAFETANKVVWAHSSSPNTWSQMTDFVSPPVCTMVTAGGCLVVLSDGYQPATYFRTGDGVYESGGLDEDIYSLSGSVIAWRWRTIGLLVADDVIAGAAAPDVGAEPSHGTVYSPAAATTMIATSIDGSVSALDDVTSGGAPAVNIWGIGPTELPAPAAAIAIQPDGGRVFVACANGQLVVVDGRTGKLLPGSCDLGTPAPAYMAISPLWPRVPIVMVSPKGDVSLF